MLFEKKKQKKKSANPGIVKHVPLSPGPGFIKERLQALNSTYEVKFLGKVTLGVRKWVKQRKKLFQNFFLFEKSEKKNHKKQKENHKKHVFLQKKPVSKKNRFFTSLVARLKGYANCVTFQ